MTEIRPTKKNIEEIDKQFDEWKFFMNNILGILAFNLGMASLGTKSPSINGILSLVFLFAVWGAGRNANFPRMIDQLRKKKNLTAQEEVLLKGSQGRYLSLRSMVTTYLVFTIGYLFLASVTFSSWAGDLFPILDIYFK